MAYNGPVWAHDFDNSPRTSPVFEQVDWMKFIHSFGKLVTKALNPFVGDDESDGVTKQIHLNSHFMVQGGAHLYPFVEEYWARETKNHSWSLKFAVMLDNDNHIARIECYDTTLVTFCKEVMENISRD